MNEILKFRLVGAVVVVGLALLISLLLPRPGPPPLEDGMQRVRIDLATPPESLATPAPTEAGTDSVPMLPPAAPGSAAATLVDGEAVAAIDPEPSPADAGSHPAPADDAPVVESGPDTESKPEPVSRAVTTKPAAPATPADAKPAPMPAQAAERQELRLETRIGAAPPEALWRVQVGSFSEIGNARQAQDKLKAGGFPSIISPAETDRGTLYRVQVGPFREKDAAGAARARILALGFAQAAVIAP